MHGRNISVIFEKSPNDFCTVKQCAQTLSQSEYFYFNFFILCIFFHLFFPNAAAKLTNQAFAQLCASLAQIIYSEEKNGFFSSAIAKSYLFLFILTTKANSILLFEIYTYIIDIFMYSLIG